jgi:hypothetical protein
MKGPDQVEITLIYHVCYIYEGIHGDNIIRRKQPIDNEISLGEVRRAIKAYLEAKEKRPLEGSPVFTNTPVLLGAEYTLDGKPYIPPLET